MTIDSKRSGEFVIEYEESCYKLRRFQFINIDVRDDSAVRPGESLLGCRIATIYQINDAQLDELELIGDSQTPAT